MKRIRLGGKPAAEKNGLEKSQAGDETGFRKKLSRKESGWG